MGISHARQGRCPSFTRKMDMDLQYYPTGAMTAALMWNKFKRPVLHVCDPSAGRGHLIRHALNAFAEIPPGKEVPWFDPELHERKGRLGVRFSQRDKFSVLPAVSVVEINLEFHDSLRALKSSSCDVRVVGYDFMQVQSLASVTHIIANPPFAHGVEHTLHAWDVVYDAEICVIINAESIKNPCTAARRRLCDLIDAYGSVEFFEDQFKTDVERTTTVEIAMVYLDKRLFNSQAFELKMGELKKGDNLKDDPLKAEVTSQLALPTNLVENTYYRFCEAVEAARRFSEYEAIFTRKESQIGVSLEEMQAKGVGSEYRKEVENIQSAAQKAFIERYNSLKAKAWAQIIRSPLLTDKLSNQARRSVEAQAASIYELEFSIPNVYGFLHGIILSMGDIYADMICSLFDTIIERSTDNVSFYKSWKSNQKHRIGMKICESRFIIPRFRTYSNYRLEYESRMFLSDIDKVFGFLDGCTDAYDGVVQAFDSGKVSQGVKVETKYFYIRYYQGVGTLHFYPKDISVVDRINKFVGKIRNWIPNVESDANEDFNRQYVQSTKLSKQYTEIYAKKSRGWYGRDPGRAILAEVKKGEGDQECTNDMINAIAETHAQLGIKCGPSLSQTPTELKLIGVSKEEEEINSEQFELILSA